LAFVDDATSRLMQLRFVASESAFDYFRATRAYLETHGKPVALYCDKGITQFGHVLTELNIDIICANSSQAMGRVERTFGTLQDRLVTELRLAAFPQSRRRTDGCPGSWPITMNVSPARRRTPRTCTGTGCARRVHSEWLPWHMDLSVTGKMIWMGSVSGCLSGIKGEVSCSKRTQWPSRFQPESGF
jgi:hypothetical protein